MISIICAMSTNRGIGNNGKLIHHIPSDMARFKQLTTGHSIIMGRKTHESIGRTLPHRKNIILSRNQNLHIPDCQVCNSLESAIYVAGSGEIFIIGGGDVFRQAMPLTDKLYLTIINSEPDADTFFPDYSEFATVVAREQHIENDVSYTFLELTRC